MQARSRHPNNIQFSCATWIQVIRIYGGSVASTGGRVGWTGSLHPSSLPRLLCAITQSLRSQALRPVYVISTSCIFPMSKCYQFCSITCFGTSIPVRSASRNRSLWHRYFCLCGRHRRRTKVRHNGEWIVALQRAVILGGARVFGFPGRRRV